MNSDGRKETGIGFTSWSIERIRTGAKTATRRMPRLDKINKHPNEWTYLGSHSKKAIFQHEDATIIRVNLTASPGDRIWVREAWKIASFMPDDPIEVQFKDGVCIAERDLPDDSGYEEWWERMAVQSTDELIKMEWPHKSLDDMYVWKPGKSPLKFRPSIHLPRRCSRIDLICTGIKVEWLKDITEEQARAEGCDPSDYCEHADGSPVYRNAFFKVWERIYGIDNPKAVERNPWVFAVEFELEEDRSE